MKEDIIIEHMVPTKWWWVVGHPDGLVLPNSVDIGAFCYINAQFGVTIGEDVEIGSHSSIYSHSTIDDKQGEIIIGNGAKIGTHSTIMPGVTIGENALIGAYSFVNKDIPANSKAWGVPVKIVKLDYFTPIKDMKPYTS